MANHKSAEKRHRQSLRRKARNTASRVTLRTLLKNLTSAMTEKKKDSASDLFVKTVSALHRAAGSGLIPKQRASRKVARLSSQMHTLGFLK